MIKLGILFGGRSGEHEISLMSAASVIKAAAKDKYRVVPIGITKKGDWLIYEGPVENIEDGSWQQMAEAALAADPEKYELAVIGNGRSSLKGRIDFALPILHGPYGEDGTIQGLFEMLDIPYGGCGVTGSALAMDKILAKTVFAKEGLPQGPYIFVLSEEILEDYEGAAASIEQAFPYPVFVKPANMGSSVGISKVKDKKGLRSALTEE